MNSPERLADVGAASSFFLWITSHAQPASFGTYAVPAGFVENLASSLQLQAWVQESSTEIVVQKGGGAAAAAVTNADIQNNTRIDFSFNYLVA